MAEHFMYLALLWAMGAVTTAPLFFCLARYGKGSLHERTAKAGHRTLLWPFALAVLLIQVMVTLTGSAFGYSLSQLTRLAVTPQDLEERRKAQEARDLAEATRLADEAEKQSQAMDRELEVQKFAMALDDPRVEARPRVGVGRAERL